MPPLRFAYPPLWIDGSRIVPERQFEPDGLVYGSCDCPSSCAVAIMSESMLSLSMNIVFDELEGALGKN